MSDDLEKFLLHHPELVIVNFWERGTESSLIMEHVMREFERIRGPHCPPLICLDFLENQLWAMARGIFGTPGTLVYFQGKPLFRLLGLFSLEEFLKRLHEKGL